MKGQSWKHTSYLVNFSVRSLTFYNSCANWGSSSHSTSFENSNTNLIGPLIPKIWLDFYFYLLLNKSFEYFTIFGQFTLLQSSRVFKSISQVELCLVLDILIFWANLESQISHLKGYFPSWTDSTMYVFLNIAIQSLNLDGFFHYEQMKCVFSNHV